MLFLVFFSWHGTHVFFIEEKITDKHTYGGPLGWLETDQNSFLTFFKIFFNTFLFTFIITYFVGQAIQQWDKL